MNTYIIEIQSTDNRLIREMKISADYLIFQQNHYQFLDINEQIIACFPIEKTIIYRIKEIKDASN